MAIWTRLQGFFSPTALKQNESYENVWKGQLLHERFSPATILEPREEAPPGRIFCKHCQTYLMIGAESVSHQNLVRKSIVCMDCGDWAFVDEGVEVTHQRLCRYPNGDMVKYGWGGSQARATVAPDRKATQEEAASWPHG